MLVKPLLTWSPMDERIPLTLLKVATKRALEVESIIVYARYITAKTKKTSWVIEIAMSISCFSVKAKTKCDAVFMANPEQLMQIIANATVFIIVSFERVSAKISSFNLIFKYTDSKSNDKRTTNS
mmetsp:Transcript_15813/g.22142  ORF Transcript_15813/g.22142 Transcript_15813/m.22142 type:complete len:125 (-) Transcript_15813:543-917(-)